MSTHTVYRFVERRGFEGLQAFTEPIPAVGEHDILVRARSVGLNFRDIAIATDSYPLSVKDRVIPCSDMVGEVAAVGRLATGFAVGDRVMAPPAITFQAGAVPPDHDTFGGPVDGLLAEYTVLPARATIKLPKSPHSFAEWAAFIGTGATVWNTFYGNKPLLPGESVLLQGTGGVSLTALIIAKAAGATTIITSSSDAKLETAKSQFGADYTVNYKTHPNWAAEVLRITEGRGVDHVVDIGGFGTLEQSLEAVAPGGTISLIGFLTGLTIDRKTEILLSVLSKSVTVRGIMGGSRQQLEEAVRLVGSRQLPAPLERTFKYDREDIIAAFEYVGSGKHTGKICINLD